MYSSKRDKRGRTLYFKGHKLISKTEIPDGAVVTDRDFDVERVDQSPPQSAKVQAAPTEETAPQSRDCVVCGEPGTRIRSVNNNMIRLCDDHYERMTVGEIVQVLREKQAS